MYLSLKLFKYAKISDIKPVFVSADRNNQLFRVNNRLFVWKSLSKCENLNCCCKEHWIAYMLFLQVLLQIQSDPTQATRDLSSSNRGRILNQVCSSFENPNPLKVDERLDVLVVAELSLDRIWGRFYV